MKKHHQLLILLFFGLLLRLILVYAPGFEGDIAFWKSWSLAAVDKGVVWLSQNTTYNYPAGFTLVLWLMGKVYRLLAGPFNSSQYWLAGNYLFLFIAKLPSILADLGIGTIIFLLASQGDALGGRRGLKSATTLSLPARLHQALPAGLTLACLYLFNPAVIYDGVWWGQVDSFGIFFVFLTFFLLSQKKPLGATVALTAGCLLKMQNIIFFPLFLLYLWRTFSWKEFVKSLAAVFATFLVITLPFLWVNNLGRTFTLFSQNSDWFPYLSLKAYNPWWLIAQANWQASDKILTLGITSAKTLGLILFSGSYFLALWLIAQKTQKDKDSQKAIACLEISNLILAFTLAAFSFFMLPTQSHERYIFPALVLTILILPDLLTKAKKNYRQLIYLAFGLISLTTLINLNNSLISFYPQNGWPFLTIFNRGPAEKIICFFNLLFYLMILSVVIRKLRGMGLRGLIGPIGLVGIIGGGLLVTNISYFIKGEIPLTRFKPVSASQEFGSLQVNRCLKSAASPQEWCFLAVNYFFYRQGLATHANSKIVFDINRKFSNFSFDYGIDSDAGGRSSAIFEIEGDGKKLFTSPVVKKSDLPRRGEVSVQGVKTLTLLTYDAGDGNFDDHTDWLEPILSK